MSIAQDARVWIKVCHPPRSQGLSRWPHPWGLCRGPQNPDEKSDEVFIIAKMISADPAKETAKVATQDGKEQTIRSSDVWNANPNGLSAPDNTMLIHLSAYA